MSRDTALGCVSLQISRAKCGLWPVACGLWPVACCKLPSAPAVGGLGLLKNVALATTHNPRTALIEMIKAFLRDYFRAMRP
jgi:hypothetical protein